MIERLAASEGVGMAPDGVVRLVAERDRLRQALVDIRAEISHGATVNWDYIDRRFADALDASTSKQERDDDDR